MRPALIKWTVGMVTFFLPAMMTVIGLRLDKSVYRHDPVYTALIPVAGWSAIVLAVVVPAALVLTTRMSLPRRLGCTVLVWVLLLVEFYLIFISAMAVH